MDSSSDLPLASNPNLHLVSTAWQVLSAWPAFASFSLAFAWYWRHLLGQLWTACPSDKTIHLPWNSSPSLNRAPPKSCEILMFVCLQKRCRTMLWCHKDGCNSLFWLTTHHCGITALFGIFLETNKHQNLTRLRPAVRKPTPVRMGLALGESAVSAGSISSWLDYTTAIQRCDILIV